MIIRRSDLENPEIDFYTLMGRPTYGEIKELNPTRILVEDPREIVEHLMGDMYGNHLLVVPVVDSPSNERKSGERLKLYPVKSQSTALGCDTDEKLNRRISELEEKSGRELCHRGIKGLLITPQILFREAYFRARDYKRYVGIDWTGIGVDRRKKEIRAVGCINGMEIYCLYHPEIHEDNEVQELMRKKLSGRGIELVHAKKRDDTVNVQIDSILRDRVHEFDITNLPVLNGRQYAVWFNVFTTCNSPDGLFYTHFGPGKYTPIYFCMYDIAAYIESLTQRRTDNHGPRIALFPFLVPTKNGVRLLDNMRNHVVVSGKYGERKLTKTEQEVLLHLATIRFGYDRIWRDTFSRDKNTKTPFEYSLTVRDPSKPIQRELNLS